MDFGRRVGELDEDSLIIFEDFWEADDKWSSAQHRHDDGRRCRQVFELNR